MKNIELIETIYELQTIYLVDLDFKKLKLQRTNNNKVYESTSINLGLSDKKLYKYRIAI